MNEGLTEMRQSAVPKSLLRGDSLLSLLVFAAVAAFLVTLLVSIWQNSRFQRGLAQEAELQNAKAVGRVLARASEALLAADELPILRRTVTETSIEHRFQSCRIVLPDGGVIAASDPTQTDIEQPPDSWAATPGGYSEDLSDNSATYCFPLMIPGRGGATLEVVARTSVASQQASLELQTTQMAIACLSLAMVLLVYHHASFRLRALGAVQQALLATKDQSVDFSSLELDPQLGHEAVAWNRLVGEKQADEVQTAIERVKESVHKNARTNAELLAACDALPQGLMLVTAEMTTSYANGAASVLLRKNRDEIVGDNVSEAIEDAKVLDAIRRASGGSTCLRVTAEIQHAELAMRAVLRFTLRPLRQEDRSDVLVVIEDISQHQVAEEARMSFLARAAHELRTPLANIGLYVESAIESCQSDADSTAQSLNVVNQESRRLDRVVSEILSISEIEAGAFSPKKDDVSLEALMEQLEADYGPQAKEKKIKLVFDLPPKLPVLHADRDKIALAMHNLVGNALKYTQSQGRVTVTATVGEDQIAIEVSDTGLGISPADTERIFEKFYRAQDKRLVDIKGSGLGLAIARDVIRLHGGDITVESELNNGSTFTVTLPIAKERV
jgi:signal transduction histidine kinase